MVEPMRLPNVRARVRSWRTTTWWGWAGRYVPPEVSGLITALAAGVTAGRITGAPSAATLAGSLGETVGYYAAAGLLEARRQRGRPGGETGRAAVAARTLRGLLVEFGPADLLDTLLVRPAFMYAGQLVTGDLVLGLVAGKLAADVVFYAVVIPCYQFRKHVLRDVGAPDEARLPSTVVPTEEPSGRTPYLRPDLDRVAENYSSTFNGFVVPGVADGRSHPEDHPDRAHTGSAQTHARPARADPRDHRPIGSGEAPART